MNSYFKYAVFAVFFLTLIFSAPYLGYTKNKQRKVAGVQTVADQLNVYGIILPHHDLASEIISKSFEKIANNNYPYIVIFGPNHFEPEINSFVTTRGITDFSFVSEKMNDFLLEYPEILISDVITSREHSITLYLPYIKHYFPESRVIPLIISPFTGKKDLTEKVKYLTNNLPEDTLYIAGVDFAHGKTLEEGLKNNEESIQSIKSFDFNRISTYTDDHMDSPLAIYALLTAMQEKNKRTWETLYTSHSGLLTEDPQAKGTSYVIGTFK